jgi:hypothetical protein
MDDHYAVLGVSENATLEEIRAAWRRLVFKHHPDRNPHDVEAAHQATIAINLAKEILTNSRDRGRFDDVREYARRSPQETWDAGQQRAYEQARSRYQESEDEARERLRKWFYERLGVRSQKRHRCYAIQGNGTTLDNLLTRINERLGDRVWEYRIRSTPDSGDRMAYRIRIVCDPTKCAFREYHHEWVQGEYHGLFKPGSPDDEAHNTRLVRKWIGDILDQYTCSHRIRVFFGVVGQMPAPWRCHLKLAVVVPITAFDAFFHAWVPGLSVFGKENRSLVACKFAELAGETEIRPADLCRSQTMRRDLARRAENVLRRERGMRTLREWATSTS